MDEFMARALFDLEEGYYTTQHVFGRKGDFVTSPEISQIFGEMIAIFAASTMAHWRETKEAKVQLVEMGPGRGTLMHDVLRTMQYMPANATPDRVRMIEASENLRNQQAHILAPFAAGKEDFIAWVDTLDEIDNMPSIIIANEFFDALPVRQLVQKAEGWMERMVGEENGVLIFTDQSVSFPELAESSAGRWITRLISGNPEGMQYGSSGLSVTNATEAASNTKPQDDMTLEFNEIAAEIMQKLCDRLARHGGMAMIIDYGYTEHAFGDTLQAVKNHTYAKVLEDIGEVDITAHVNFAMLKEVAQSRGLDVHALITQGEFLKALGAELRLSKLCQTAEPGQIIDLIKGLERLISPAQMGELFKVLIVAPKDWPVLHPFT